DYFLQRLPGHAETVGQTFVADPRVQRVLSTGSNQTAQRIQQTLAQRLNADGQPVRFVAETGGINALIADSSALPEQVVTDAVTSAFDAAGQRCSALRLLYLQADTADTVIPMLKGAMNELVMGNPADLATDIGPVIDAPAMSAIDQYIAQKKKQGHVVFQTPRPAHCARGTFIPPTLIEVGGIEDVPNEIFGPVLHVATYNREERENVMRDLNGTGYGLTFGVHTRIDEVSKELTQNSAAGNLYVNRNIIGATVGVQPFGGQGLSGTGPKAGGPLYLRHLLRVSQTEQVFLQAPVTLPGPTGESNHYWHKPRGRVLCVFEQIETGQAMLDALKATGNTPVFEEKSWAELKSSQCPADWRTVEVIPTAKLETTELAAVLFEGDADKRLALLQRLATREGAIVPLQVWSQQQSAATAVPLCLLHEVSLCVNTAAAGGNASLMTLT
ncbi:MAG: aldehyde dehydrogenase family protein, partial [Orrella sp.]